MTSYPPKNPNEVAKSTAFTYIAAIKAQAYYGLRIFICGNCECLQVYVPKPIGVYSYREDARCTACGEVVDWNGTKRIEKKCPKCRTSYESLDFYCRYCSPKTKLETVIEEPPKPSIL